jgi:type IV secretory pathway VirB3-like protein
VLVEKADAKSEDSDGGDDDPYRLADETQLPARSWPTHTAAVEHAAVQPEAKEQAGGETTCPACGAKIIAGEFECRACRYDMQLGRRVEIFSGDEHYADAVGFERYLLKRLHQAENLTGVMIWFHVFSVFMVGVIYLVVREWWIVIPIVVLYAAYHLLAHANRYFYRGKSFIWWLFLRFGRIIRWRRLAGFKKRNIFTTHDPSFNDERLGAKGDMDEFHVIDIQGTSVSDEGLQYLDQMPFLEILILKNTKVTGAGVANLQSTNPDACIWY